MATITQLEHFFSLSEKFPFSDDVKKVLEKAGWKLFEIINDVEDLLSGTTTKELKDRYAVLGDPDCLAWSNYVNTCVARVEIIIQQAKDNIKPDPTTKILNLFGYEVKIEKQYPMGKKPYLAWVAQKGSFAVIIKPRGNNLICKTRCNGELICEQLLSAESSSYEIELSIARTIAHHIDATNKATHWACTRVI